MKTETIILGGGCFWCMEAVFSLLKGVLSVTPGYAGGTTTNPTYEDVCSGTTNHAEVVKVGYDREKTPLDKVLSAFFSSHDPTTMNQQGNDVGTQYRSIILFTTEQQKKEIEEAIKKVQKKYEKPIVTEVKELDCFYPAEEEHHRYFEKNPRQAYCRLVIAPKVEKVKRLIASDE
ncbi:peptide-methionine (S)-S-oxide reductase MsrA [Candidatus Woesearchaeota archaeon]|nr:peptide-methionine (S)-S-oxide reductase MsrA [Candidatus Woesearchaeota archaeon]